MTDLCNEHIERALKLNSRKDTSSFQGTAAKERSLDNIVQYFISEFEVDPDELRVSEEYIVERIYHLLNTCVDTAKPVEEFATQFEDLPDDIASEPMKQYILGFPLNISSRFPIKVIKFQGYEFTCISKDEWDRKFGEPALKNNDFAHEFSRVANEFRDDFTYWKFEFNSRDPSYVLDLAERQLRIVLGQLIYCLFPWHYTETTDKTKAWNEPWSELRNPFVYILRNNEGIQNAYFDDDISPRGDPIYMLRDRQERLKTMYQQIPELDNSNPIEEKIINAFQNLQFGATEANVNQAFLHYWRAVETLCLLDDKDSNKKVVERTKGIIDNQGLSGDLIESRLHEIRNKRNSLVHKNDNVTITERDTTFLRYVLYEFIKYMIINKNWEKRKIEWWLDNASKPIHSLEQQLEDNEDEIQRKSEKINIIRSILDSR